MISRIDDAFATDAWEICREAKKKAVGHKTDKKSLNGRCKVQGFVNVAELLGFDESPFVVWCLSVGLRMLSETASARSG